jgi:hypothetical protein
MKRRPPPLRPVKTGLRSGMTRLAEIAAPDAGILRFPAGTLRARIRPILVFLVVAGAAFGLVWLA